MKKTLSLILGLLIATSVFAQKTVYVPRFITNQRMDLNDPASQWSYSRSVQTENFIVFWEEGYGNDPSTAANPHRVNMNALLETAEKSYTIMLDSLGFAVRGSSVLDRHKMIIFMLHSTQWAAFGSGQDNLIGTLHVNGAAARSNTVLAHEIGHCFQYITGCDTQGGYRYGFGPNGSGGNGFWEQCANWKAFEVYPESQFTTGNFTNYIRNNHLHILHETPRYANYFLPFFWNFKRGQKFMGRLWRDSRRPEDPVETYKRLNSISQSQFNDEIYEHAARLTTWDIPSIKSRGAAYINSRAQVRMSRTPDNFWRIDPSVCIENYGYNSIKLNAPSQATTVTVNFTGLAGQSGYRALNVNQGGWRYGFVALLRDGTRVYSDMERANVVNGNNPQGSLSFDCPDNCVNLWLVVSGSPQQHWKHPWDDDNTNDEHWPYQVQFQNTNLLGEFSNPIQDATLTYDITMDPSNDYTPTAVMLNSSQIAEAFSMSPDAISRAFGSTIRYYGVNPNGTLNATSTANAPGHWYSNTGATIAWGNGAFVFSELNINNFVANVGQYPNRCQPGDKYTIRQALVYTKSATETARVTLVFNISITPDENQAPTVSLTAPANNASYTAPASITITANASDSDGSVAKVEFFNGSSKLGEDLTSPYSFTWNNVAAGTYTITAKATDNQGAETTSAPRTVVVNAPCTPTTIIPYTQINGGAWSQTSSATLIVGNSVRFGPQPVIGGSWSWSGPNNYSATSREITLSNIQTNQAGNYVATYTNAGGCTSTNTFVVTVNAPANVPPTVSLTAPANNASFTAPASITISANAADSDGTITNVQFYNGTTLLHTDATAPYSFTWNNVAAGTYTITARATDNSGATTTSTARTIVVNNPALVGTDDVLGPDCGALNSTILFEVNPSKRTGATAYSWYVNGYSKSITPVSGSPFRVNIETGEHFTNSEVCVGVSYNVAPWYATYCKPVSTCPEQASAAFVAEAAPAI
ncbi:MAG: DUF6055 domain-containing protein, partial [Cytophagaceae bacterium]